MIPYGKQNISQEDKEAIKAVLESDYLTTGPATKQFEQDLAQYCKRKYAVTCSSGTAALHLSYLAANLQAGDEVITTPNTFAATANMLIAIGAKPVFCDISLQDYNLDVEKIEALITDKTKAIVPVHFGGQSCNMQAIWDLAAKHNLIVIEDACHALGAKYKDQPVGSGQSLAAVFSFHPVKPITTGEGGAVVTDDQDLYEKMVLLRSHGIFKDQDGKNVMTELGYNYRMSDIQAALGSSQLKRIDDLIQKRQQVVSWYQEMLNDVSQIALPQELDGNYSGWHLYVIQVKDNRDQLSNFLKEKGIGVNFHYPAVYSHPYYRQHGYQNVQLENMDLYHNSCLTLPCYPDMTKEEVVEVVSAIKEYFK